MVKKIAKQVKGLAKALPVDQIVNKKTIDKHTRKEMEKTAWGLVNKMMTRHSCRYSQNCTRIRSDIFYEQNLQVFWMKTATLSCILLMIQTLTFFTRR